MDPLVAYGLISGGGAVLGGLANFLGGSQANSANLESVRETNAQNYKMFQEAQAFNRQERLETQDYNRNMWYEQQRYNSPGMQAFRLRQAGLNPTAVLGGQSGQSVSSIPASTPASSPAPPTMQAPYHQNLLNSQMFTEPLSAISDALIKKEQAFGLFQDNQTRTQENIARIDKLIAEKDKIIQDKKYTIAQRRLANEQKLNLRVQRRMLDFDANRQSTVAAQNDEIYNKTIAQFADAHDESLQRVRAAKLANDIQERYGISLTKRQILMLDEQIREKAANIELLKSSKAISDEAVKTERAKAAKLITEDIGLRQNQKHFNAIQPYIYQELENQGKSNAMESNYLEWLEDNRKNPIFRMFDNRLRYTNDNLNKIVGVGKSLVK